MRVSEKWYCASAGGKWPAPVTGQCGSLWAFAQVRSRIWKGSCGRRNDPGHLQRSDRGIAICPACPGHDIVRKHADITAVEKSFRRIALS